MINLGILNACTPQDEVEFGSSEYANFQNLFSRIDQPLLLTEYRITEGDFPEVTACDAYLITGSPKGAYDDDPWIARLAAFIRTAFAARRKLVGICFGHQILAQTLGGYVAKSKKGWGVGLCPMDVSLPQAWMRPVLPQGALYFCHQDQVMHLPPEAALVAGNDFCPNGMFLIHDRVLGIQAHPEFTPRIMAEALAWLENISAPANLAEARATIATGSPDNEIMAHWIINFLTA